MIGLYFRTIPDANLLDTVCISMRACIFPAGSHKGVVFASLSVSISDSLSFSLFFCFRNSRSEETGYNRAFCRKNSRDATILSARECVQQDGLHSGKCKANCCNSRINARTREYYVFRIRFFVYCQTCITPFRRVGVVRRECYVNVHDAAVSEYAAEKSQPYAVVKIKFSEYCRNT